MKDKRIIIIYVFLVIFLFLRLFLIYFDHLSLFNNVINPVYWFLVFACSYVIFKDNEVMGKYKYDKLQNMIIILITFIIVYFLLGLVVGYQYSPYAHDIGGIFKNILMYIPIIVFQEYARGKVVALSYNNSLSYIIISFMFTLVSLNFLNIADSFSTNASLFQFVCQILLPLAVSNIVLTYLSFNTSWRLPVIYRSFMVLIPILSPILPAFNWLFTSIIEIIVPVMIYFSLNNFDVLKSRYMRRDRSKSSIFVNIIFFGGVSLFILFIVGVLKYKPVAIMSNSMVPIFARGDSVIIEKCDDNCLKHLKVHDIIYFRVDNDFIVHRINDVIKQNGKVFYITKGDNNNVIDPWKVKQEDISGKVMFSIPYVGYPSVVISEFLSKEGE